MSTVSWEFVRDHILTRLTDLEEEVRLLRMVCWPVCQAISENNQISDIENKSMFFRCGGARDYDEFLKLLKLKSKMYRTLNKPGGTMIIEEIERLSRTRERMLVQREI